ncbi:MAG: GGDEF domain-containing protein [Acidobacteriaceae bacterium]
MAALAIGVIASGAAWAADPYHPTTLSAVHILGRQGARRQWPVAFEATVVYYRGYENMLFVEDRGEGIYVRAAKDAGLISGDRVLVWGRMADSFRPWISADRVRLLRHGRPPDPVRTHFDELIRNERDCTLITVRAVVQAADPAVGADGPTYLQMLTPTGTIDAVLDSDDSQARRKMLDAEVDVTGVATAKLDGKQQQTGVKVYIPALAEVKILKIAAAGLDALPIMSTSEILHVRRVDDRTPRVRVHGSITYYQPGSMVVLESGGQSIRIMTEADTPLQVGDAADATGFPDVEDGFLALVRGEVRDNRVQAPTAPQPSSWQELSGSHHVFDLVSLEAMVVAGVRGDAQDEYVLNAEGHLFSAIYHLPDAASHLPIPPLKQIPPGARVRVSGICMLKNANPYNGQVPFDLLLRSQNDIAVVARPAWLNVRDLTIVVGLLTAVLWAGAAWVWTLRRKVHKQTAELAKRIEAETILERRRGRILEDINGSRPLAEIIEEITELVSANLGGVPCWCELSGCGDGTKYPPVPRPSRVVREEIPAHTGPSHGAVCAALDVDAPPGAQAPTLALGARLVMLAVETRGLYADLKHRSEFDLLTDIHNRFSLDTCLDALIAEAAVREQIFALIYIDLDRFKEVNDRWGHRVGDEYLQLAVRRMKAQLRPGDMLARLGGDEFAALVATIRGRADAEEVALRLERCFDEPLEIEGLLLRGSASVGVAVYPEDATSRDRLLSAADSAMYAAKYTRREMEAMQPGQ